MDDSVKLHRYQEQIKLLTQKNKELSKKLYSEQRKIDLLYGIRDKDHRHIAIKPEMKTKSEAVAVMLLSDVHFEEKITYRQTNGLNRYNPQIAEARLTNFFRNGIKLFNICRRDIVINNIILAMLGDLINGYIHEEYLEDNYLSPSESIIELKGILISGIKYILDNTKCKLIIPCKLGNHGRTTQQKRISTSYKNSFEWILYKELEQYFEKNKRVRFIIDDGYLTYINVFNKYLLRFHHGDAINYYGGVGGITIPIKKAIANWNTEGMAYLDIFGHFHTLHLDGDGFVCNGSVVGHNAYGIYKKIPYRRPEQAFFLIDKMRGKTICAPIIL